MLQYAVFFGFVLIIIIMFIVSIALIHEMHREEDIIDEDNEEVDEELLKTINLEINEIKTNINPEPLYDNTIEIKIDGE